jgi:hypothetical protein
MQYLLLLDCNNGCTNVPLCYVIRTLRVVRKKEKKDKDLTNRAKFMYFPSTVESLFTQPKNVRSRRMRMWRTSCAFSRDKERNRKRGLQLTSLEYDGETFSRTSRLRITSCVLVFTAPTYVTYQNHIHNKIKRNLNLGK